MVEIASEIPIPLCSQVLVEVPMSSEVEILREGLTSIRLLVDHEKAIFNSRTTQRDLGSQEQSTCLGKSFRGANVYSDEQTCPCEVACFGRTHFQ